MIEVTVKTLDSANHKFSVPDDVSSSFNSFLYVHIANNNLL